MSAAEPVVVGRIGAPYGVQGWVHIRSYTSPPENLLKYLPWLISDHQGGSWQSLEDVQSRAHKKGFVARLGAIADRDEAAALAGKLIAIPASSLPVSDGGPAQSHGSGLADSRGTAAFADDILKGRRGEGIGIRQ